LSSLIAGDLLRYEEGAIRKSPSGFAADPRQALLSARGVTNLKFDRFIGYHGYTATGAKKLRSDSLTPAKDALTGLGRCRPKRGDGSLSTRTLTIAILP
jgi:glyoxylase-like metal-dependent hydrolase (beta-lactamase superfamily II)